MLSARCGILNDNEAINKIFTLNEVEFRFTEDDDLPVRRIKRNTSGLLKN